MATVVLCLLFLPLLGCPTSKDKSHYVPSPETPAPELPTQEQPAPETGDGTNTGDTDSEESDDSNEKPDSEVSDGSDSNTDSNENTGSNGNTASAKLQINELRTEGEANGNRVEFVEFKVLSAGDLEGLTVVVLRSGNRTPTRFVFPSENAKAGEYAVLYLRVPADRDADSTEEAHNFWIEGRSLLNKTSAVYVEDKAGKVMSAVMLSERTGATWNPAFLGETALFLFQNNAWKSTDGGPANPDSSVITSAVGTALTRSVSRDETAADSGTSADWYITANNGATPGRENSTRRLQP